MARARPRPDFEYSECVWSCMLQGSEMCSLKGENELALHQVDMRMIRWMCGVKLRAELYYIELVQWC